MSNYKAEFANYDQELSLPDGWIDTSWHNDICPSFENKLKDITYKIWCDYKDPEKREVGGKQFTVAFYDFSEFVELQDVNAFDTLQEALDFVNKETEQ